MIGNSSRSPEEQERGAPQSERTLSNVHQSNRIRPSTMLLSALAVLLLLEPSSAFTAPTSLLKPAAVLKPITARRMSEAESVTAEDEEFYLYGIEPKTKSVQQSMAFYARFVVSKILENRRDKKLRRKGLKWFWRKTPRDEDAASTKGIRNTLRKMNEQRRNLAKLAGYTAPIIIPSFTFLVLGALMTSIIPQFYSECVQCVATQEASKAKVIRALTGLTLTSILGAAFTGMRGSLFWMAGEF